MTCRDLADTIIWRCAVIAQVMCLYPANDLLDKLAASTELGKAPVSAKWSSAVRHRTDQVIPFANLVSITCRRFAISHSDQPAGDKLQNNDCSPLTTKIDSRRFC